MSAIPLINILTIGYLVEVANKTFLGSEGLPEWDNWGQKLIKGLTVGIYALIYSIPFILVILVIYFVFLATDGMPSLKGPGQSLVSQISALFYSFLLPAIVIQYVRYSEKMVASVRLADIRDVIMRNLKVFAVLAIIYVTGVGAPMLLIKMYYSTSTTGLVVTAVVSAFPGFYLQLFLYNLYGQLLANDEKRTGQALAT